MTMLIPDAAGAAAHALSRFGFGAAPGDPARLGQDARGWVESQIGSTMPLVPALFIDHPGSAARMRDIYIARRAELEEREQRQKALRESYRTDIVARTRTAIASEAPFLERLVQFWSNHFTVSSQRGEVAPLAVAFENEAIRPNLLGRFEDMAKAAILHPAMLVYLDNVQSVGPGSRAGTKGKRGLNENLGREALELHTLGVNGGYDQDDVRSFALILTGWTINKDTGEAQFTPNTHEPGAKTLVGHKVAEAGAEEAGQAIAFLANHPATARHVAVKLARHFIADDPPDAAVKALERRFRESGGDLPTLYRTLVGLDAAWAHPLAKLRSPNDFLIATLRATDLPMEEKQLANTLGLLGQMPFSAPSPAGWPDRAADWAGPDAMVRRVDWSLALGQRIGSRIDARSLLPDILGGLASDDLRRTVERAPSPGEALALTLLSPAFQRR